MASSAVLGIDTSAYTTSVALLTPAGKMLCEARQVLTVPQGARGLRQSDAVYQHVRNLPNVMKQVFSSTSGALAGICASTAPRPVTGSFMPVFMAGLGAAQSIGAATGTPVWKASHQEGHLWAALWSLPPSASQQLQGEERLLVVHLSGGTTEALLASGVGKEHYTRPELAIVGKTADISAGQFIDRVGTAIGLPFPAGPHLQSLVEKGQPGALRLPMGYRSGTLSFSGPESAAQRLIASGANPADLALAVLACLAKTLECWLSDLAGSCGVEHIVLGGGVAANCYLRHAWQDSKHLDRYHVWFANQRYCSDNAVGLAAWGAARLIGCPILALPERGILAGVDL